MRVITLLLLIGCSERAEQASKSSRIEVVHDAGVGTEANIDASRPNEATADELPLDAAAADDHPGHPSVPIVMTPGALDISEQQVTRWFSRSASCAVITCLDAVPRPLSGPPFIITTLHFSTQRVLTGVSPPESSEVVGGKIGDLVVGSGDVPLPLVGTQFVGLFTRTDRGLALTEQLPMIDSSHVWLIDRTYSIDELTAKIEAVQSSGQEPQ